jgi:hypothetical protein
MHWSIICLCVSDILGLVVELHLDQPDGAFSAGSIIVFVGLIGASVLDLLMSGDMSQW